MQNSDLELTVLEVCSQGGHIAPIGAWKDAVERLAARGLLRKLDEVNYVITPDGSAEFERLEAAELGAVIAEHNERVAPVIEGEAEECPP